MKNIGLYIDHIGFLLWMFLIFVFYNDYNNKKIRNKLPRYLVFAIAFLGIIIDGYLLINFYMGNPIIAEAIKYDLLGIPVFSFLIGLAIYDLTKGIGPKYLKILLLVVSIGGLIADGGMIIGLF
ncbi:MAG: hypothetical protein WC867_00865 [Candidatus Pacearchaeota archaeon]|jgi:hypothetical protein